MKYSIKSLGLGLCLSVAAGLSGCGSATSGGGFLNDTKIRTYSVDGDLWAEVTAQIGSGQMVFTGVDIPIVNPHNPGKVIGHLSLRSSLSGQNELSIAVRLGDISGGLGGSGSCAAALPNGLPIPIGGLGGSTVNCVLIGNSQSRLYTAYGSGVAMLGLALPFKQFDNIGQYLPGVGIFTPINQNGIKGAVGIFTGAQAATSGLALFIDLSSVMPKTLAASSVDAAEQKLKFTTVRSSLSKSRAVLNAVQGLMSQNPTMRLH